MATQWPQQYQGPHNNNNNYNGYQQQYSQQQQHQQQQQQQQQYQQHAGQNGNHQQQQYQPNARSIPPQPGPNSCYNCGAADHWAQDCPEPRRELPAGLIHRQNYSRPFKRHKPNAPIVTKYAVPPHVQQQYGPAQGYGGGQYGQPGYPPQQGYGPPTPMSTQSPSQVQWQQSPQYQNYQQPFEQGNQYQQNGPYPQHSYPTPTAQTPSSYYGNNNNSHQSSPQGPPYNANFYPQQGQYSQPQSFQGQAFSGASPGSMISPSNGQSFNQYPEGKKPNSINTHQGAYKPSQTVQSHSATTKPKKANLAKTEPEEDDIYMLDVPDMPPSSKNLTDKIILSGGSCIHLVGRPLDFDVADDKSPPEPPQAEDQYRCQSKYWGPGTSAKLLQNVKDSSDWVDVLEDAIFAYDSHNDHVIPLDDLLPMKYPRHAEETGQEPEAEAKAEVEPEVEAEAEAEPEVDVEPEPEHREATLQPKGRSSPRDSWDVMDSLENALNAGRQKETEQANQTNSTSEEHAQQPKDTEELLAALGVTGAPKPVRAPARPYPPPSQELMQASPKSFSRSRSRTPTRREINGSYRRGSRSNSGIGSDRPSHDVNGSLKGPDTYNYKQSRFQERFPGGRNSRGSAESQYSHQFDPPPPPPPPSRKPSFPERAIDSPPSAGSGHGDSHLYTDHHFENGNGYGRSANEGHSISPTKLRSERSNGRKREYDNRESSDESETPGRRQVDDVTPKLKRRQPKVAEAYSRRW